MLHRASLRCIANLGSLKKNKNASFDASDLQTCSVAITSVQTLRDVLKSVGFFQFFALLYLYEYLIRAGREGVGVAESFCWKIDSNIVHKCLSGRYFEIQAKKKQTKNTHMTEVLIVFLVRRSRGRDEPIDAAATAKTGRRGEPCSSFLSPVNN